MKLSQTLKNAMIAEMNLSKSILLNTFKVIILSVGIVLLIIVESIKKIKN